MSKFSWYPNQSSIIIATPIFLDVKTTKSSTVLARITIRANNNKIVGDNAWLINQYKSSVLTLIIIEINKNEFIGSNVWLINELAKKMATPLISMLKITTLSNRAVSIIIRSHVNKLISYGSVGLVSKLWILSKFQIY